MSDLKEAISLIKRRLPDYLSQKCPWVPVVPNGHFKCVCPNHDDSTASMNYLPGDNTQVHCFGCDISLDTFEAAHILEGLPNRGVEFYTETVPALASRFGIDCPVSNPSEEQVQKAEIRRVFRETLSILSTFGTTDEGEKRGLSKETCEKFGIFRYQPGFQDLMKKLKSRPRISQQVLDLVGMKPSLFGSDILTFTVYNPMGDVVAFSGRDLKYQEKKERGEDYKKYDLNKANPIFEKGSTLYGYHLIPKKPRTIYVVEGFIDVAIAHQKGLTNCVGLCGTAFTPNQHSLLENTDTKDVILCLDRDSGGDKSLARIIARSVENKPAFRLGILSLPEETPDPDDFLIQNGIDAFRALHVQTLFECWLNTVWEKANPQSEEERLSLCEEAASVIAQEPSPLRRVKMVESLSNISGFPTTTLSKQVDLILNCASSDFKRKIERIKKSTINRLSKDTEGQVVQILTDSAREAKELYAVLEERDGSTPRETMLSIIEHLGEQEEEFRNSFYIKTGFEQFDRYFGGIPLGGYMIPLLGRPSSGKSSLIVQMVNNMMVLDQDLIIRLHSIDDPMHMTLFRLICCIAQIDSTKKRLGLLTEEEQESFHNARKVVSHWTQEGRLEIRDASMGYTVDYGEQWVASTVEKYPGARILYILDNLYKTFKNMSDIRAKVETAANHVHVGICQELGISTLCTVEPKRVPGDMRSRLNIDDVKESAKLEQNAHVAWIIHNGMPPNRPSEIPDSRTREWWCDKEKRSWPMAEIEVAKNKEMGPGLLRLFYHPGEYTFREEKCVLGTPDQIRAGADGGKKGTLEVDWD